MDRFNIKFNIFSWFHKQQVHRDEKLQLIQELVKKHEKLTEVRVHPAPIHLGKNRKKKELRRKGVGPMLNAKNVAARFLYPWSSPEPGKPFDDGYSFIHALGKKGFVTLGSGMYSTVMAKNGSDRVLKIIRDPQLDNWVDYIQWAVKKEQLGRYAPKVFSYKLVKGRKSAFAIASVERLPTTLGCLGRTHPMVFMDTLIGYAAQYDNDNATKIVDSQLPGMVSFMKDLRKEFAITDFHGGNYMIRSDGTFVITDPVHGAPKKMDIRLRTKDLLAA